MTTSLIPYLFFGGHCDEAIEFYPLALDATLIFRMGFNESPEPVPEDYNN